MSEREAAREMLRELLHEALAAPNGGGVVPQVPPPPVAAVHRPEGVRPLEGGRGLTEPVVLATDADLDRFVRSLLARPQEELEAIRAGRLRFTLGGAAPAGGGALRVERGAVTERKIQEAAKAGGRIVLGRGAVLTPLGREKARALGVQVEREQ
jgi:hypothetical protein